MGKHPKAIITDAEALRGIHPSQLVRYFEKNGWNQRPCDSMDYAFYRKGEAECLVPLRADFADYAARVSEALGTASEFEQRSQIDIYEDLIVL